MCLNTTLPFVSGKYPGQAREGDSPIQAACIGLRDQGRRCYMDSKLHITPGLGEYTEITRRTREPRWGLAACGPGHREEPKKFE